MASHHKLYGKGSAAETTASLTTPVKTSLTTESLQSTRRKSLNRYPGASEQSIARLMKELETMVALIRSEYPTFIECEKSNIKLRSQNRLLREEIEKANTELANCKLTDKDDDLARSLAYQQKIDTAKQSLEKVIHRVQQRQKRLVGYLRNLQDYLEQDIE